MLPEQAFDRAARPLGRVIGMDLDPQGNPKGYVILLEGTAASTVLGEGASRGLLVVPVDEAEVRNPAEATADEAALYLKSNMDRLRKGWAAARGRPEDEDPAAW